MGPIKTELKRKGCDAPVELSPETLKSHQAVAKMIFDKLIAAQLQGKDPMDAYNFLKKLKTDCTEWISCVYLEMLNELNLAQVFLWFQEKGLMSSCEVWNKCPGISF